MTTRIPRTRATVILGFGIALLAMMFVGALATHMTTLFVTSARQVTLTGESVARLEEVLRWISRAESEQRGYILTGRQRYLMLFDPALEQTRQTLADLIASSDKRDQDDLLRLTSLVRQKFSEMESVIQIRRTSGANAAMTAIDTDQGLVLMDRIRSTFQLLRDRQTDRLQKLEVINTRNRFMTLLLVPLGLVISVFALLIATVLMVRDGSRIREAEVSLNRALALQSAILNGASVSVIALDVNGFVTLFNATAEKWFGKTASEVVGRDCVLDLLSPDQVLQRTDSLEAEFGTRVLGFQILGAPARAHGIDSREWLHVRADGTTFPALVSVAPLKDEEGQVFGYVIVSVDLSEREDTQRQLAGYVADLERASMALEEQNQLLEVSRDAAVSATNLKSEFLANMSHEIRTPMNGIIGIAHLLLGTPLSEKQRAYANTVQQSAESLLRILNDILDLSKIEAGKMNVDRYPFDLGTVVRETVDALGPLAHQKGLRMDVSMPRSGTTFVIGDSHRLRQVLSNLLSNAIKFTTVGGVVLEIEELPAVSSAAEYRFAVRDTGIGIPPDRIQAIFESFTQADMTTARSFGGTGLGLAISKQLVSLMGGELMVTSSEGRGSEFSFVIALERQPLDDESTAYSATSESELTGTRVLLVADDSTERNSVQLLITSWGGSVVASSAGEEALRVLANDMQFTAGIVSLRALRGADFEFAKRLRATEGIRRIPLVLITSILEDGARSPDFFASVLSRPVVPTELHATLAMLSGQSSGDREAERLHTQTLRGLKVLVVEDNATNQLVVEAMLRGWQCEVETVPSGEKALAKLETTSYDAVLMDVQMPVMDGLEATRRIRAAEIRSRRREWIIAMTANALLSDRDACLQAGMDRYLAKPVSARDLFSELERRLPLSLATNPLETQDAVEALLNLDRLHETCQGKQSLELKVLERYEQNLDGALHDVEASLRAGDMAELRSAAHALKGSSLTVGAERLGSVLKRLELQSATPNAAFDPEESEQLQAVASQTREAIMAHIRHLELK